MVGGYFQPRLWTTVCAVPVLVTLLGLGFWQVERLNWKLDLIAQREAALTAPPREVRVGSLAPDLDFARVRVRGHLRHDREIHLIAPPRRGRRGYHVLTPLQSEQSPVMVLVDRGWVPDTHKLATTRRDGLIDGTVELAGIARTPRGPGWFTPDNEPARNIWYWPDMEAMASHVGMALAPIIIEADTAPNPGGFPVGGQTRIELPNSHLGYAITWFGLAGGLIAVYIAFHWRRKECTE